MLQDKDGIYDSFFFFIFVCAVVSYCMLGNTGNAYSFLEFRSPKKLIYKNF